MDGLVQFMLWTILIGFFLSALPMIVFAVVMLAVIIGGAIQVACERARGLFKTNTREVIK